MDSPLLVGSSMWHLKGEIMAKVMKENVYLAHSASGRRLMGKFIKFEAGETVPYAKGRHASSIYLPYGAEVIWDEGGKRYIRFSSTVTVLCHVNKRGEPTVFMPIETYLGRYKNRTQVIF